MKKTLLLMSTFMLINFAHASNSLEQDNSNWNKTFTMANKMVVIHNPDGMNINMGGLNMTIGGEYRFSKNSNMNGISPSADGSLKTEMTLEQFRTELKKFGTIVSEK